MLVRIFERWVRPADVKRITLTNGTVYVAMDDSTENFNAPGDQDAADNAAKSVNRTLGNAQC